MRKVPIGKYGVMAYIFYTVSVLLFVLPAVTEMFGPLLNNIGFLYCLDNFVRNNGYVWLFIMILSLLIMVGSLVKIQSSTSTNCAKPLVEEDEHFTKRTELLNGIVDKVPTEKYKKMESICEAIMLLSTILCFVAFGMFIEFSRDNTVAVGESNQHLLMGVCLVLLAGLFLPVYPIIWCAIQISGQKPPLE